MLKNKWFLAGMSITAFIFGLAAIGCQSTPSVTVKYTEPARLNMSGINKIAVDSDNASAVSYISGRLTGTGKYTLATDAELREWKQWWTENEDLLKLAEYQKGAVEISPVGLVKAYTDNAARANSTYEGKALKISGTVTEIGQSGEQFFVRLGAGSDSVDVYFRPSERQKIESVNKGQQVTIFGDCNGFKRPNMADTAEILRILGAGQHVNVIEATFPVELKDYPGNIDAVISMSTTSSVNNDSHTEQVAVTDNNGNYLKTAEGKNVYRDVTVYDRSVSVSVSYSVVKTPDSVSIGQGEKTATSPKSSNRDPSQLPAVSDLAARTINEPLGQIAAEMVPTSRSLSIKLEKSDSKDKAVKTAISEAQKLVKANKYADAAAAYGKIYAEYQDFASGYNEAVLTEVTQGTEAGIASMEALAKSTNNAKARDMLREMQTRNEANQKAAEQLAQ
ncbi:MAG: OB-fold putative lipoprotein [Spirochaetaceae bacterium]|jgi:hypothetical protein|nr:OB-fold putative lipoprotein [Spirochaetaceae bacterium]